MLFSFSLKSSLLLIFFFHGCVFSVLLWVKGLRQNQAACKWLGAFTILGALYIAPFMLGYAGWYGRGGYRELLFYVPFQQLLVLPPTLYFYIRSLLDQSFVFQRKHLLHFMPGALYLLYSLIVFVTDQWILGVPWFYADGKDKDFDSWYQLAGFVSLLSYLVGSLALYRRYRALSNDALSFADSLLFRWAQRFLVAFVLLVGMRALFFILNPEWAEFGRKFWYYLGFSFLFYYISISGYSNTLRSATPFSLFAEPGTDKEPQEPPMASTALPDPELEEWKNKILLLVVEGRLFENPLLTIGHLAERLGTHSKRISNVINQGFGMNFNDFINSYRIEEVTRKINSGEADDQTLMGIAYDAGFNSKSTFNRAFRRLRQCTPKEYLDSVQKPGLKS